ncbi:DUF6334 family protein [Sphingomonas sp. LB-2]|uniref:DUF6334 family protein n=1 Tax=Sphingomonas caeni TaxID=2984949 RepID=UPI00222F0309|nr:DUF6334 family protein [Sphingomonas caeni]MCW3846870.1 DUF6334 family protein [Sphingomonas caeni]
MTGIGFDWDMVDGETVTAILGVGERRMNDGTLSWEALAFAVGEAAVVLTVNRDTDEVEVAHGDAPDGAEWAPVVPLAEFLGKPLGWSWVGTNNRGYQDVFMMAFGSVVPHALDPRLMFIAAGSELSCSDITAR